MNIVKILHFEKVNKVYIFYSTIVFNYFKYKITKYIKIKIY